MKQITSILAIFFLILAKAGAEDTTEFRPSYILFGNYQQNYHKADFQALPGIPNCCPEFKTGEGIGYSFGLNYQFPLPFKLSAGLGLGYYDFSGELTTYETQPIRIGNRIENALINHTIEASLADVGLTPYLSYNLIAGFNITLGGHIGMIVRGTFRQYEQLIEPSGNSVFVDTGTRIRNDTSGTIPNLETVYTSLFAGVSYDIRLNPESSWIAAPSLTYNLGRTNIVNQLDWRVDALMIGLQLKYSPPVPKVSIIKEFKRILKIDTLTFLSEDVNKNTIVKGEEQIRENEEQIADRIVNTTTIYRTDTLLKRPVPRISVDINVPVVHLEGQFVTQAFPLVPVVFFDENSSDIQKVYHTLNNTHEFEIGKIKINSVEYQRELLNIIGLRMHNYPKSSLYIAGYCDSISEGENYTLAKARVDRIIDYLTNTWNITPKRLKIKYPDRCFPIEPTATKNDSGFADNRRVELSSDNPDLLAPIKNKRYIEPKSINPPMLIFDPSGSTSSGINNWKLIIRKGDIIMSQREGTGYPGILIDTLKTHDFNHLFSNTPVTIEFSMTDFEGQTGRIKREIPVVADTSEYELQRLSLILFEVGSEKLNEKSRKDIRVFLQDVEPNSFVKIKGYTDPLGSYKLNRELSTARANNTADYIKKNFPNLMIQEVTGMASEQYPPGIDSYQSPIERFLARTVFIEILNRIK